MKRDPLQDFIDFLKLLNAKKIKYLIVEAHAMSHWGYTRATGDIDVLIDATAGNLKKVVSALKDFGAPIKGLSITEFETPGTVFQIGVPLSGSTSLIKWTE